MAVIVQHRFHEPVAVIHVGKVTLVGMNVAASGFQFSSHLHQAFFLARANHQDSAGIRQFFGCRQTDTGGTTGDHTDLSFHGAT